MMYSRHVFTYLKNLALDMFNQDIYRFTIIWISLSFLPLLANTAFEFLTLIFTDLHTEYLEIALLFALPLFAGAFAAFLFISLWVAFESKVPIYTKLVLIMLAYILIWLSFGNLYYFFASIDSFGNVKQLQSLGLPVQDTIASAKKMTSATLSTLPTFWEFKLHNNQLILVAANRLNNYFDCLYFSGINILTVGFGDIVPLSRFVKMLVLLECFLGMIINVLAVGIWLSNVNKKD